MSSQTPAETAIEFEKLFGRPPTYFKSTPARQWEIAAGLGILVEIDQRNLTPEMMARWKAYFK